MPRSPPVPEFEVTVEAFYQVGLVIGVKHTLHFGAGLRVVSFAEPHLGFGCYFL